jgi:hypothetical protein
MDVPKTGTTGSIPVTKQVALSSEGAKKVAPEKQAEGGGDGGSSFTAVPATDYAKVGAGNARGAGGGAEQQLAELSKQLKSTNPAQQDEAVRKLTALAQSKNNTEAFGARTVLAQAPRLTPEAITALGSSCYCVGGDSRPIAERLGKEAQNGSKEAVAALAELLRRGDSTAHDAALDGLSGTLAKPSAATPDALEALATLNKEGRTIRNLDGVNHYYAAALGAADPQAVIDRVKKDGKLGELLNAQSPSLLGNPAHDKFRGALTDAALAPPGSHRTSFLQTLNAADRQRGPAKADEDIARASKKLAEALPEAAKNSPELKKLVELSQLRQKALTDKSLAAKLDMPALNAQLQKLAATPSVRAQLDKLRNDSDVMKVGDALQKRMESPLYQDRLRLMNDSQRQEAIKDDLAQLARIDPNRADAVAHSLAKQALKNDPFGALAAMKPEERKGALTALVGPLESAKSIVGPLGTALEKAVELRRNGQPVVDIDQLVSHLPKESQAAVGSFLKKFPGGVQAFGVAVTAASLGDAISKKDLEGIAKGTIDMVGSVDTIAKVLGAGGKLPGWVQAVGKGAGTIGATWDAISSGMSAWSDFKNGDYVGGAANTASTAGNLIMLGAPLAGPAAPAVALVGLGLSVGGKVVDHFFGQNSDEELARNAGVWKK